MRVGRKSADLGKWKNSKKENSLTSVFKTEQGGEAPKLFSKNNIAQENAESKGNSEPVKKSVRFQMAEQALGCQLEVFLEMVGKNDIKHWSAPHPWHP